MSIEIVHKTEGSITTVEARDVIVLDKAGIVRLKIGPETVERFERVGNDLQLVLKDGRTITLRNFFVVDEDGKRHDLVLEDADEVLWWGQYTSPWTEFHFTEITGDWAAAAWLPHDGGMPGWAMGLAALVGGVAIAGANDNGSSPNLPPTAPGYTHTIAEDTSASGRVVGTDPNGDNLTYAKGSDPSHGTVVVNPDGSYTYTPDPDYHGPDSFTVTVSDGKGGTTTSTVTITVTPVNDPVLAGDDSYTVAEDGSVALDLLGNDSAPDGGLAITSINGVALTGEAQDIVVPDGTVRIDADGGMRFVPAPDFNGTASFPYTVRDADGDTDTATVTITVAPVNDPPVALVPGAPLDQVGLDGGTVDVTLDLPALFDDVDGDTLTHTVTGLPPGLVFDPATGRITGTIDNSASQGGPDEDGVHTVTVVATDPSGETATHTFTWTVANPAPQATDDVVATTEDTTVSGNVLAGTTTGTGSGGADTDPDGDALVVTGFQVAGDPATHAPGSTVTIPGVGSLTLGADGGYSFVPVADWNGTVPTVTYTISDGEGGQDSAELVITVTPVADIADDGTSTAQDQPVTIDVLDNDGFEGDDPQVTAIDGTPISVGDTVPVANGSVRLNADGTLTFTPEPGFTGTATYTYTATSGGVDETATVTVQVVGMLPTTGTVSEAGLVTGTSPGDGSESTGGTLNLPAGWTVVPGSGSTAVGDWEVLADGSYTFTLTGRTTDGVDDETSFTYTIENTDGDRLTQTVTISITDDAPVARPDSNDATEDLTTTVDGNVLTGPGGDSLGADGAAAGGAVVGVQAGNVAGPVTGGTGTVIDGTYGTLTLNADGSYTYTLDSTRPVTQGLGEGETGLDVFTYTIEDGDGDVATTTLTINVAGADDGVTVTVPQDHDADVPDGNVTDHVVFESGLANGSAPEASGAHTTVDSSFTIDALDGLSTLEVGGVTLTAAEVEALGTTPRTITTAHGTLVLDGYAQDPATGRITIDYTYTLTSAPDATGIDARDDIAVRAVDRDGDAWEEPAAISIRIVDDAPVANDDGATVDRTTDTVSGSVITGAGADVPGADGATVTGVASGNVPTNPSTPGGGGLVIEGEYGQLVIRPDGTFTYTRTPGTEGGVQDVFTYTLTDGDGDNDTATLTIDIPQGEAPTIGSPTATVSEGGLPGGTGTGSDTASGSFTFTAPDGVGSLTIHGVDVTGATAADPVVITTPEGHTLSVTGYSYDPVSESGAVAYTYILTDREQHPDGGGTNNVSDTLAIEITDLDGDGATSSLVVTIVDDVPSIGLEASAGPIIAHEGDLATNPSADLSYLFDITYGADGQGAVPVYSLSVDAGVPSGLVDTASGQAVVLSVSGNVVTGTAGPGGPVVFTLEIDPASGVVTLDQVRALEHADSGPGDAQVHPASNAISIGIVASDGDGDIVSASQDIGGLIWFLDDGPVIDLGAIPAGEVEVDETALGAASGWVDFTGAFTVDFGADGAGSMAYSLELVSSATGLVDTATGDAVVMSLEGGTIVGRVEGSNEDVFTIEVNAAGEVQLTQLRAISHPDGADHDDTVSLPIGSVVLSATATDADGDTASATIGIGNRFVFADDGPTVNGADNATVDEQYLPTGSEGTPGPVVATGTFDVDFGADGAADIVFTADTIARLVDENLSAGGAALVYELADSHTVVARNAGGDIVFTVQITDPTGASPGYTFTLHSALTNPGGVTLTPDFHFSVIDADGDSAGGQFTVDIVDDTPISGSRDIEVDEDGSVSFTTSADGNPANVDVSVQGTYGIATVGPGGVITYEPFDDYSGSDTFTYTTLADDGSTITTVVNVTVAPVADAPDLGERKHVVGNEDSSIALGLDVPAITDDNDQNGSGLPGDHGERIGIIIITLQSADGAGVDSTGATLTLANGTPLVQLPGNTYAILIVEGGNVDTDLHHAGIPVGTPNANYLTRAEYEGLMIRTASERHENIRVEVEVTSHEVDDSGARVPGIPGATSTQYVDVGVQAVTDGVGLQIDVGGGPVDAATPATAVDVPMAEDTAFNLATLLRVLLDADASSDGRPGADTDGSEDRWFVITGLPEGAIVNGHEITAAESVGGFRIDIPGDYNGDAPALPAINVTAPQDFSGTLAGIQVTLNAQDHDSDGTTGSGSTSGAIESDSVYLNLVVAPVAGDVEAGDVTTAEDMAVAFLQHVRVTDEGTADGTEIIDSVSFALPPGWTLIVPPVDPGWSLGGSGTPADPYVITFSGGEAAAREAVLDAFQVRPPAHSSADATVTVTVITTDSNPVTGTSTVTTALPVHITVNPVAERTDGDSNGAGGADVTMNGDHTYTVAGFEDEWFALNSNGFNLAAGWSNEDGNGTGNGGPASGGSEQTFARLTPIDARDSSQLDGSSFRYFDGSTWHTRVFNGSPVDIPLAYLDTVEFRGPLNFKGEVDIRVQAVTVDTDEDDPSITNTQVSGEAWLRTIELEPVADMVTLRVEARVVGEEDTGIALTVRPTSSDPSEEFTVTIRGIPAGATLDYDGQPVTLVDSGDGTFHAVITDFDASADLLLTPPPESNASIRLQVDAVSVDGTSVSPVATLPIDITVRGIPDAPVFTVDNTLEYVEADLDAADNTVELRDLVTELRSGEVPDDGSETVTLRISGLGEGFSVVGAGPVVGNPSSAETRVWVVTADQIANGTVRIQVPPNFAGQVSFTAQPVVTENDNPSELFGTALNVEFVVTPSPEATLSITSTVAEDTTGALDFSAVQQNGEIGETIAEVRFRVGSGAPAGVAFFDGNGDPLTPDGDGWYVVTGEDIAGLQVRAPANFSGSIPLEVRYSVTDPGDGTGTPVTSGLIDTTHTIVVQPVTDQVEVDVGSISISGEGGVIGTAVELDEPGTVTVDLDIAKAADPAAGGAADHDGSEVLTHIVITGVPDGVSVTGAIFTGDGSWLVVLGDGFDGPIDRAVQFVVDGSVANLPPTTITITAYTQDGGAESVAASTTWTLETAFGPGDGDGQLPTVELGAVDTTQLEDAAFSLSDAVSAALDTTGSDQGSYNMTVTLRTSPGDTTSFDHPGMVRVEVMEGGVPVVLWMVTVTGVDNASAQQALDDVLDAIQVHAPEHANRNNLGGPLELDVTVTLYNAALRTEDSVRPPVDIAPVTDPAVVDIAAAAATEGEAVAITVNVASPADQDDWSLVDGRLYLQLGTGLDGELSHEGSPLTAVEVTGVPGLADGFYYVIDGVVTGTPVSLSFQPDGEFDSGSTTLQAWVRTVETGGSPVVSGGSQTLVVAAVNTPPDVTAEAQGLEHDGTVVTRVQVQLTGDVLADGGEALASAFIEGLPADFTVHVGSDAANTSLANNAGGGTWSIPVGGGALPAYIAIQAPAHWSGTLPGVVLYLVSGEPGATPTAWPVPVVFTVAPQADGLDLSPTLSFGREGGQIALNLNASLVDPRAANGSDVHEERATVELTGFPDGELVRFQVGGVELGADRATWDAGTGTWRLTGLSQAELDALTFVHAATGDETITVRAWTQEYDADGNAVGDPSDVATGTVTINVADQLPTMGDDVLLWTGDEIDGRDGHDVVLLREGSLTGGQLADRLVNIEELDLGGRGPNAIEDLTPEQVRQILGVAGDTLRITGTSEDSVELSGAWTETGTAGGYTIYQSGGETVHVSTAMSVFDDEPGFAAASAPEPTGTIALAGMPDPILWHAPHPMQALDELLDQPVYPIL